MIFLTFVVATVTSVLLLHQWYSNYQDEILKPDLKKEIAAFKSAFQVFAFRKTRIAERNARWSYIRQAFHAQKQRRSRVYQELSALHANKEMRSASMLIAADISGRAFARTGSQVRWRGADWGHLPLLKMAGRGLSSYRMMTIDKMLYLVVAAPIWELSNSPRKKTKAPQPQKKPNCPRATRYRCRISCLVWNPATGACQTPTSRKVCGCFGRGRWSQVRFPALPAQIKTLSPTSCPDSSAYKCQPLCLRYDRRRKRCRRFSRRTVCACYPGEKIAKKKRVRPDLQKKIIGILLAAYQLDSTLISEIQKKAQPNVTHPSELLLYTATTKGEQTKRALLGTSLLSKEKAAIERLLNPNYTLSQPQQDMAALLKKDLTSESVELTLHQRSFLTMSSGLQAFGLKTSHLLVLKPMSRILQLSKDFVLNFSLLGLAAFLLMLLLIFPSSNRYFRDLEVIELKLFEAATTNNLSLTFHEQSHGDVRSLAAALDMLFRRLRGEVEPEDQAPDAIQWEMLIAESENPNTASRPQSPRVSSPRGSLPTSLKPQPSARKQSPQSLERKRLTALVQAYRNKPEEHYQDVWKRYRAAMLSLEKECGEEEEKIFIDKIRQNAEQYRQEYLCEVFFDVDIEDKQVVLKPLLIPGDDELL
jgi:hypothetical protein